MNKNLIRSALLLAAGLSPSVAFAHPGHEEHAGFTVGFMHPIGGLDHVLVMLAVGLFAFQLGGRALWLVPVAFVTFMAIGGGLGMAGIDLPFAETGIAVSVVALGMLVAVRARWDTAIAASLVATFALFHGYAHGAEMPAVGSTVDYSLGFMMATALLHAAGIAASFLLAKASQATGDWVPRGAGAAAACVGALMLTGQI